LQKKGEIPALKNTEKEKEGPGSQADNRKKRRNGAKGGGGSKNEKPNTYRGEPGLWPAKKTQTNKPEKKPDGQDWKQRK